LKEKGTDAEKNCADAETCADGHAVVGAEFRAEKMAEMQKRFAEMTCRNQADRQSREKNCADAETVQKLLAETYKGNV
jgi:hypothetical protein